MITEDSNYTIRTSDHPQYIDPLTDNWYFNNLGARFENSTDLIYFGSFIRYCAYSYQDIDDDRLINATEKHRSLVRKFNSEL